MDKMRCKDFTMAMGEGVVIQHFGLIVIWNVKYDVYSK